MDRAMGYGASCWGLRRRAELSRASCGKRPPRGADALAAASALVRRASRSIPLRYRRLGRGNRDCGTDYRVGEKPESAHVAAPPLRMVGSDLPVARIGGEGERVL